MTQCFARETKGPVWTYLHVVNHIRVQMPLAPRLGEPDLFLPLPEPSLVLVRGLFDAKVTGHAVLILGAIFIIR